MTPGDRGAPRGSPNGGDDPGGGWIRRSIAEPSRLEELTDLYRSLGFEVRVAPLHLEKIEDACTGCARDLADCRAIYTRSARIAPQPSRPGGDP